MPTTRPILAITMGDPAGCGPEITARTAVSDAGDAFARLMCVGEAGMMARAYAAIGCVPKMHIIQHPREALFEPGTLELLDLHNLDAAALEFGKVQASAGKAAYEYITRAIELAMNGDVDGVVTAPINKEALNLAGYHFAGHTEIFAQQTGTQKVSMMLASKHFRVTHVSTHVSLRKAVELCKTERILEVLRITHLALLQLGIADPFIAVAGLNPHCGEGGLFGDEDEQQIQPAIDLALAEGMRVYPRPIPADTVFQRMLHNKEFDAVVAQYHDQGHIAAKLVDFFGGVNITLGLPIVRVSVDHGTAFDIAGKGIARADSLISAIEYAAALAVHRPGFTS